MLGAADGEGGADEAAAALDGTVDDIGQFALDSGEILVEAVTVGGLHDEVVGGREVLGITDDRQVFASDIAGEDERAALVIVLDVHVDAGGSEHVAGVVGAAGEARTGLERLTKRDALHQRDGGLGVSGRIEGFHDLGGVFITEGTAALFPFRHEQGVLLLDVCRIGQHGGAEIDGARSGKDGSLKPVLHEGGQVPGMVDMGVGEDDALDGRGGKGEGCVAVAGIGAAALIEPAVKKVAPTLDLELVHGAGDGLGSAPKIEFHCPELIKTQTRRKTSTARKPYHAFHSLFLLHRWDWYETGEEDEGALGTSSGTRAAYSA